MGILDWLFGHKEDGITFDEREHILWNASSDYMNGRITPEQREEIENEFGLTKTEDKLIEGE